MNPAIIRTILFVFCLSVLSPVTIMAQDTIKAPRQPKNRQILERIDFGGYLGAQFGTQIIVEISPLASYRVTDKLYAGLGLTYLYYHYNIDGAPDISMSSYGGSIFAGYYIWQDLFAHVEYAPLYIPDYYDYYGSPYPFLEEKAPWAHDIYLGGGYRQWIGENASINMMLLFNINETEFSRYSNPIIRIGFGVGL